MFHPVRSHLVILCCILSGLSQSVVAQTTWEFDGRPYAYQKSHFDSATNAVRMKLGIQMRTFGAPYNQIDTTLIRVMREDTSYKVLLLGQNNPPGASGIINLTKRVMIESATGVPSYSTFVSDYTAKKATYTEYMVMQGHPYAWTTTAKQNEFKNIVNYLIAEGVKFVTPYEYYQYVTDLSIPRTTKVHVILKLDDVRATSSYFLPCFPTFDFLVSKGVKSGLGVNFMGNITKAQTDTLQYYLSQKDSSGALLFEVWNHGLDHSMSSTPAAAGNWSSPSTWTSGELPSEDDDVTVASGSTITIDMDSAVCRNLTINGTVNMATSSAASLTVTGNVQINAGGVFNSPSLTGATANIIHALTVYGNFTNAGGSFDFRAGSNGSTLRGIHTTFSGSENSVITVGPFSSTNNDFNGITVNKTDGAKVICASDVFLDQGATGGSSQLIFQSGMIETGVYSFNVLSLNSADIIGASPQSYVNGSLGRGMSNSSGTTKFFPVGDAHGYRPLSITSTTSGAASTHYVKVRTVSGVANTGASVFTNGIDAVSNVRYFEIGYHKGTGAGAASMTFSRFQPSYGTDDGVAEGNTDLRVAVSTDQRVTWNGMLQSTPHLTILSASPTVIAPDTLPVPLTLQSGSGSICIALAKKAGTHSNTLPVRQTETSIPSGIQLLNVYPNPFNPSTTIRISNGARTAEWGEVTVFNLLGIRIATLFSGTMQPGTEYTTQFNASDAAAGIYFCRLSTASGMLTRKILLVK